MQKVLIFFKGRYKKKIHTLQQSLCHRKKCVFVNLFCKKTGAPVEFYPCTSYKSICSDEGLNARNVSTDLLRGAAK